MSVPSLFGDNAKANSLLGTLTDTDNNLLSGNVGGERRRISLSGGKFREIINGEQVRVSKEDAMNIVIIDAAKISRTYYSGQYDPSNIVPPACWSHDTQKPAPEVPEETRQSDRCMDCPQNIKGSGQGESRACRFGQRLAVVLEGQLDKVYQLQLAATSIFGESKDGKLPMQGYARLLHAHKTPHIAVVTQMYFDENSNTPKLFFKPVRPLEEDELQQVLALKDDPATKDAITMTVSQTDSVKVAEPKALFEEKPKPEPEAVEEPKKVVKKQASVPTESDPDIDSIIEDWQD